MGRLAVRRVVYSGEKYSFESPYLNDGLVIMEGVNGHGKSTFMNLIYYGFGGRVQSFNKSDDTERNKHNEICNDKNNYVELLIEIDDKKYELTRYIGDNIIFVVGEDEEVIQTCVYRNHSDESSVIFSDWILKKLDIDVFDIVQGTKNFKLNFTDLLRLIYHDQATEVDKIYKEADNSNFLSDSLEIRKAIFEVLLGKTYNDYYYTLGQYKLKLKEYEKSQAIMNSYDDFLGEVLEYDLENVIHINAMIAEHKEMIERVQLERNVAMSQESSASVPKRLMYFLTLLIESLKNDINFPRFLMIDTPNKEGIDKDNLIKNIELLTEAGKYNQKNACPFQIILTTGIDTYPDKFKDFVFYKLEGEKYLLQENSKSGEQS